MKLFVIYIGGAHERSLIELHDIRFIVAEKIEKCYDELKNSWWGIAYSLHIDAYGVLEYADGYDVYLSDQKGDESKEKLYFLNLGGYDSKQFSELHKNIFVVAENESQAKIKGLKQISSWQSFHRDYQYEVENILDLSGVGAEKNLYLQLKLSKEIKEFEFVCKYLPIGGR